MSHTETHFGKLRRIETDLPIEDWCKEKCISSGIDEIASYFDSWKETLLDRFHDKLFIVDDEIWEAIEHVESDGEDMDVMIPNSDGTITFAQQFYNGGTCLSEVIEEGIKRVKREK